MTLLSRSSSITLASRGLTLRPAASLIEDSLGLEEQRLPEALGGDDDELVVPVGREEAVDLRRPVEQGLVEVLCDTDVVGVYGPGSHASPQCGAGGHRIACPSGGVQRVLS